jgi:PKD repeat protein
VPFARICSPFSRAQINLLGGVFCYLLLALAGACRGSELMFPDGGGIATIRIADGNAQSGEVGAILSKPVVVEVLDAAGNPVQDATVEFELTSAGDGAEILPSSDTTDAAGRAEAHVRLGDKVGEQTGAAHLVVDGTTASTAAFTATASAPNPENQAPHADFNWHCDDLACQFTDASGDADGTVSGWSWDFGDDSGLGDQPDPAHSYQVPGIYTVTLTVSDNDGATDDATTQVEVTVSSPPPPANQSPHADFDVHCHDRFCSFSDKSRDDDGNVVSRLWDFGDGSGSSEESPFHFYREGGHYEVTLTVTDNGGASDSKTHDAKVKD